MAFELRGSHSSQSDEDRLSAFGLSTEIIHAALQPGLSRATSRTSMALRSTPGTDIYHDSMEQFHRCLAEFGWQLVYVDHQPRLLHPDRVICFTVAAGSNVASADQRQTPRTSRKGKATRASLAPSVKLPALFEVAEIKQEQELSTVAAKAPFWLLVHERTPRGLNLELSQPAEMTASGIVTRWTNRIIVKSLDLTGDLSTFDDPGDGEIDVAVEPR